MGSDLPGAPQGAPAPRTLGRRFALVAVALLAAATVSALPAAVTQAGAAAAPPAQPFRARPNHGKLTPQLDDRAQRAFGRPGATTPLGTNAPNNTTGGLEQTADGGLVVDIDTTDVSSTTIAALRGAGAGILAVSAPELRTVTASVPAQHLPDVAALEQVRSVQEVITPLHDAACAPIVSEGDTSLHAAAARSTYNVNGTGVRVGVMSDSYDRNTSAVTHAAQDVAGGELPGTTNPCGYTTPVGVVDDSGTGKDEGRAMMQTVHSLAPGSPLSFASALVSETGMANNIASLVNAGAKVIVDDVTYFDEPFYQDGPIAAAINSARAAGVAYFSSAANNNLIDSGHNDGSYEALTYRGVACPHLTYTYLDCHDFDPGAGISNTESMTVAPGGALRLDLQWAQPWNAVTTDYDLFVTSTTGSVLASSTADNTVTQRPNEFVSWKNSSPSPVSVRMVVGRYAGPAVRFKVIHAQNGAQGVSNIQFNVSSGTDIIGPTIFGHNGASSAFTVAAVNYANLSQPEYYSSQGPVTTLFNPVPSTSALGAPVVVNKPDFAAVDCVQNSFFGSFDGSHYRFCGTSDAAPHAASVAALALAADPSATVAQLGNAMSASAVPVGSATGTQVGAGLLQADGAIAQLTGAPPPPPPPTSTSTALVSSLNPSTSGQPVTYTASVSPTPSGGTVGFTDNGNPITGCTTVSLTSTSAACTTTPTTGTHAIVATYSGTTGLLGSTSPTLTQHVNAPPAPTSTSTALVSSVNPARFNQLVGYTATVTVPGSPTSHPGGMVTFKIGSTAVFTTPISATTGTATLATTAIGPLGGTVTAVYDGDGTFTPSTSNTVTEAVTCDKTITGSNLAVTAASGMTTCLISATVTGSVNEGLGATVAIINSTVNGSVTDAGGGALRICGSTIGNAITAQSATGQVVIGDAAIGCAGNIAGSIMVAADRFGVVIVGNQYHLFLTTAGNSGQGPLPSDAGQVVSGNVKM